MTECITPTFEFLLLTNKLWGKVSTVVLLQYGSWNIQLTDSFFCVNCVFLLLFIVQHQTHNIIRYHVLAGIRNPKDIA